MYDNRSKGCNSTSTCFSFCSFFFQMLFENVNFHRDKQKYSHFFVLSLKTHVKFIKYTKTIFNKTETWQGLKLFI